MVWDSTVYSNLFKWLSNQHLVFLKYFFKIYLTNYKNKIKISSNISKYLTNNKIINLNKKSTGTLRFFYFSDVYLVDFGFTVLLLNVYYKNFLSYFQHLNNSLKNKQTFNYNVKLRKISSYSDLVKLDHNN